MSISTAAGTIASGALAGAVAAQRGVVTISTYVQRNPVVVQVFCCLVGLALSICSICSIVQAFREQRDDQKWTAREVLQSFYTFFFGLVICLCDVRQEWADRCCNMQSTLFKYLHFLATQTGRAFFYFYVGSITLLMLPKNDTWKFTYIAIGSVLCFLGLIMIGLHLCARCRSSDQPS